MIFWKRAASAGFKIPTVAEIEIFPGTECRILNGRKVADDLLLQCKQQLEIRKGAVVPHLTAILVGDDPASQVYVNNKAKAFTKAGFTTDVLRIDAKQASTSSLLALVVSLNGNRNVHGILVQLPLPAHIDAKQVVNAIDIKKDVDGFTLLNAGRLYQGDGDGLLPCTPFGIMVLLASYKIPLAGQNAVVIGRSQIVGRPMAQMLMCSDATVTIAHSQTRDLRDVCSRADIIVSAVGRQNTVIKDLVKKNAVIVDVGINRDASGQLCGDVHENTRTVAGWLTPVPGGVGPLTIATLCLNTAISAWDS